MSLTNCAATLIVLFWSNKLPVSLENRSEFYFQQRAANFVWPIAAVEPCRCSLTAFARNTQRNVVQRTAMQDVAWIWKWLFTNSICLVVVLVNPTAAVFFGKSGPSVLTSTEHQHSASSAVLYWLESVHYDAARDGTLGKIKITRGNEILSCLPPQPRVIFIFVSHVPSQARRTAYL